MNERTDLLIGEINRQKISTSLFVLAGLGGVGGTALEILTRFGAVHFILIDGDAFEESNLNRQILSKKSNIGSLKTEEAKKRILEINPESNIALFSTKVDDTNIDELKNLVREFKSKDENSCISNIVFVDAIDDVRAKCLLYQTFLKDFNAKIIASMGAGRQFFSPLEATTLNKTHTCPLAKAVRNEAKKWISLSEMQNIIAIFSPSGTEVKPQNGILPSSITQTFNMGLMLAKETIKKALE